MFQNFNSLKRASFTLFCSYFQVAEAKRAEVLSFPKAMTHLDIASKYALNFKST